MECLSDEIENIVILIHYNVLSLVTLIPFIKLILNERAISFHIL